MDTNEALAEPFEGTSRPLRRTSKTGRLSGLLNEYLKEGAPQ